MNPQFRKISRQTCRNDAIKSFHRERENLIDVLQDTLEKIALTLNLWASKQRLCYISITAHYIDANWMLPKCIISYSLLEYPHTGAKIGSTIVDKLKEFNIAQKIISLTLDNVSTNNVAAEFLNAVLPLTPTGAAIFHNRCTCHILNLVQYSLKLIEFYNKSFHICKHNFF